MDSLSSYRFGTARWCESPEDHHLDPPRPQDPAEDPEWPREPRSTPAPEPEDRWDPHLDPPRSEPEPDSWRGH